MTKIELEGGKYTIIHENGCNLRALRYGEEWRNLIGDNLVLAMAQEIERLREGNDKYIAELEAEVFRLQDELNGDGVLSLTEQLSHLRSENDRLYNKASEYASIALWCAERLATRRDAEYAYDELEKVYGYEIDRDWRGEQV